MAKAHVIRALQVLAAVILVVLAVGLYRSKSDAARTEARVRALRQEVEEREASVRDLRAEIARLESPANIEALAADRLGVVVGSASAALPETAIGQSLPPPQAQSPESGP